jgi:hypothetical protein
MGGVVLVSSDEEWRANSSVQRTPAARFDASAVRQRCEFLFERHPTHVGLDELDCGTG